MTLEKLVMYLWNEMPLTGWGYIFWTIALMVGIYLYLNGRRVMQQASIKSTLKSTASDGTELVSVSHGIGSDFPIGRSVANAGISIALFSGMAIYFLTRL